MTAAILALRPDVSLSAKLPLGSTSVRGDRGVMQQCGVLAQNFSASSVVQKATREVENEVTDDAREQAFALHRDDAEADSVERETDRRRQALILVSDAEEQGLHHDADRNGAEKNQ